MIRVYTTSQGRITQYKNISFDEIHKINNIIWIDLQSPSPNEKEFVEKNYKIEFFTSLELQEIESSSRFIETEETIEINLGVISSDVSGTIPNDVELTIQNTTFILKGNVLFTYRQGDLRIFAEAVRKLKAASTEMKEHGLDVFLSILETHIDSDADLIESINRKLNIISKEMIGQRSLKQDLLLGIAQLQENVMVLHETTTEKQRV